MRLDMRLGMNRREILMCGGAALMAATLSPAGAIAQGRYPDRPIKLIVPFAPGGATDVAGRLWAEKIKPLIGTVVIENKASGGGAPGTSEVARAQPDGYTLLFGNTSTQVLLPVLMPKPPYDPVKDFTAISIVCVSPTVIVVNEKVPVRTLPELIAYAKANPGKLSYGSAGKLAWIGLGIGNELAQRADRNLVIDHDHGRGDAHDRDRGEVL